MQQVKPSKQFGDLIGHRLVISGWRAVIVSSLFILGACDSSPKEAVEPPPPGVLVAIVTMRQISESQEYVGQTVAVNDVSLRAQIEGYLLERSFEEGQDVEQGAVLFLIDSARYKADQTAAEGGVAEAKASVSKWEKDVKRYRSLASKEQISRQALDNAESELLQATAKLKTAEASLLKTQINLSHTAITAPISGRIGRSSVSAGDLVTPQVGELARLVQLNPIYANFSVSERDVIAAKRRNQTEDTEIQVEKIEVRLRLPDGSLFEHVGRVDFIDNVVDRKTGTIVLRARFDNPQKLLVPGMYVSTVLEQESATDKLIIPQAAVQEDQAGVFVMVVAPDSKVELRRIVTGKAYAGDLVVTSGLEPGEQVIVEGIQKVRPGQLVDAKIAPKPSMQVGETGRKDVDAAPLPNTDDKTGEH